MEVKWLGDIASALEKQIWGHTSSGWLIFFKYSVVDPKVFFSDPDLDPTLALMSNPDSVPDCF
jgi:hypothetical protein